MLLVFTRFRNVVKSFSNEKKSIALFTVFLLIFLLVKSLAVNSVEHERFNRDLLRLKELDAILNQDVLKARQGLLLYYDPLIADLTGLKRLVNNLENIPAFIDVGEQFEIKQRLKVFADVLKTKEALIESFKSQHASLKNSLSYFPIAATALAEKASSSAENKKLALDINILLRDVLIYNLSSSEDLAPKINAQIERLLSNRDEYSAAVGRDNFDIAIAHAKTILKKKPQVDALTKEAILQPSLKRSEELYETYSHYHQKALNRANAYRLYLYLLSILLLGYVAYFVIKLQSSALKELQISEALRRQEANRTKLFAEITLRIRQSLDPEAILKASVEEVREALKTERVLVYRFGTNFEGTIISESVAPGSPTAIGVEIKDPCFKEEHVELYKQGRVRAINNIEREPNLTDCYIQLLKRFAVKAILIAPILRNNQLFGLMIAHHCSEPRDWQESESDLFRQLATQVGIALDQANLLEQIQVFSKEQRQQKEALQLQLSQLLSEIEEASRGNLTVRAEVTTGEIGIVADFFNNIIESLREIVTQVKKAASQVNISVEENEGAIHQLSDEAFKQAKEITLTLDSVEQMALSIQEVADSARQTAEVARTASATAEIGGKAMDRTVNGILMLRETIAETANKVKCLGESSQKISKVVSLINQFAMQTELLALNAGIEAARAGNEGRGFAVIAEEVGILAAQSAQATKEIEQMVQNIQQETSEVVRAMEVGTNQVLEGTHLVEDAKHSLKQIVEVSHQIDQLVQSISGATVSQAQTSQDVTNVMKEIANVSKRTSNSSRQVSSSLHQTVAIAQQLQESVGAFKVDN